MPDTALVLSATVAGVVPVADVTGVTVLEVITDVVGGVGAAVVVVGLGSSLGASVVGKTASSADFLASTIDGVGTSGGLAPANGCGATAAVLGTVTACVVGGPTVVALAVVAGKVVDAGVTVAVACIALSAGTDFGVAIEVTVEGVAVLVIVAGGCLSVIVVVPVVMTAVEGCGKRAGAVDDIGKATVVGEAPKMGGGNAEVLAGCAENEKMGVAGLLKAVDGVVEPLFKAPSA